MATIITKNKTTSGTPSSLAQGELAVNIADKKMFVGGSGGSSVVDLEFEKFNGGTIATDLNIEKDEPTLILDNNTNTSASNDIIGEILWKGQSSSTTQFDHVASIVCKAPTHWQQYAYANLEFYCQYSNTKNLVARFEDDGRVFMPDVYSDSISGTTRDLYIKNDGQLGYLSSVRDSKTNITDLTDVSWVYNLNPVSFNYKDIETTRDENGAVVESYADTHSSELDYGLIAEDVETVNDELVFYNDDELAGVHYKKLVVPMLKTIQDQKELIDALTARVTALENA